MGPSSLLTHHRLDQWGHRHEGGRHYIEFKVKLLDGVQGISALGTKRSKDARQGDKGEGGWREGRALAPTHDARGKYLGPSG